jgi:tetratricopeptide (TPR) repeat protein
VPVSHPDLSKLDPAIKQQIEAARSSLSSSLQQHDDASGHLADLYGNLGKLYHVYDFPDAAVACYTNAHRLAPKDFIWAYYLGRIYEDKGDNTSAIQDLKLALQLHPGDSVIEVTLGQAYMDENHPDLAAPFFESVLRGDRSSAAAMAGLGKIALSAGKLSEAIRYFESALAIQPQASSIHYSLAMAYRQAGNMPKALEHLQKRGPEKPKVSDPYMAQLDVLKKGKMYLWLQGNEAMHQRRFVDAVAAYGQMVDSDQEDALARISLGSALAQTGDLNGAIKQYTRALDLMPTNDIGHYNLGLVLLKKGSGQQATQEFQTAVRLNPGSEVARFQLANLLMRSHQHEPALANYSAILQVDPSHEFARLMQGIALVKLKRYSAAKERLQESLTALPNSDDIAQALARLLAACPDANVRDGRQALALVERLLQSERNPDLEVIECLPMALAELGRFNEAARVQAKMITELRRSNRDDLARLEQSQIV